MNYKQRNKLSFIIALFSGIMLLFSGTTGISSWLSLEEIVLTFANLEIVKLLFLIILIVASFGGLTVIIGGYLILKNNVNLGKIIILIGSGAGIISLSLNLFIALLTEGLSMTLFLSHGTVGFILAVVARYVAKSDSKRTLKKRMKHKLKKIFKSYSKK